MEIALLTYLQAFGLVFFAELGDKTQLLALSFAGKYKPRDILIGIFIAIILNHGLAIAFGSWLASRVDPAWMNRIVAGLFFFFALWGLRNQEEEISAKPQASAILAVATAFFLGEMGDKTQLTAAALAAGGHPVWVLAGTTSAMLASGAMAVLVGEQLFKRIPKKIVKYGVAILFALTGLYFLLR